jgi:pyruvate dehydrogenase E1 component beta subunit
MAVATRSISFRQALNEAIAQEMRRDPTVVMIGEDVVGGAGIAGFENQDAYGGTLGVTRGLVSEFGRRRVMDTPVSEAGFIGAAMGAAATGLRPIVELMFVDFLGVCFDQIYNQGAKMRYMYGGKVKVPVVVRTMTGAGFRAAAQHSGSHYSVFTHMPGLKCVAPSTPADAKGLLVSSIRDDDPVIFFENKTLYDLKGEVPEGEFAIPLGKADIKRVGDAVTVVAISRMVHVALAAAETLAADGVEVEVVDPRTLSPLDHDTILASVRKTRRLVVVDEDNPRCSMATDIVALVASRAFDYLDAPPEMITAPHTPVPFSPALEDFYLPNADRVIKVIRAML